MSADVTLRSGFLSDENLAAANDLYQITMAAAYFVEDRNPVATFELFVRRLPHNRSYLVVAGLEQALHYVRSFHFSRETIAYLRGQPVFSNVPGEFFDFLADLRFTGDIHAMAEGEIAFAGEPLLRVTAPIIESQLVETYLLATINFQTLVASKAARVAQAAGGRPVADFGTRRAHGPQAGVLAARACYIGGCSSTSNVLAGMEFGIPIVGTAGHSYTMLFPSEIESFVSYHRVFPDNTILLIDTYDTIQGARNAALIGEKLKGVRLDSGDLASLSREVRRILDEAGLPNARIVVSGDLNEFRILDLLESGAPVDIFGVGTEMVTSRDDPALGGVYKLVEARQDGRRAPKVKLSCDKATYPFAKQVYRAAAEDGTFASDTIALDDEPTEGAPLLEPVAREGRVCCETPNLADVRRRCLEGIERLPEAVRDIRRKAAYPVVRSPGLEHALSDLLEKASFQAGAAPRTGDAK